MHDLRYESSEIEIFFCNEIVTKKITRDFLRICSGFPPESRAISAEFVRKFNENHAQFRQESCVIPEEIAREFGGMFLR